MTTQILNFAKLQGLTVLNTKENEKEITISFMLINRINKMNKIGKAFRNEFKGKEIGWSGSWLTIVK